MKQLILALALVAPGFTALAQDLPTLESFGIKTWDAPPVMQRREDLPAGAVTVCPEGCDYTHLHMLPKNFSKPVDVGLYGGDDPARPHTYRGFSMQKRGYFL